MAIANGEQELPTTGFEGFIDEEDSQGDDLVNTAQDPEEFQELNDDTLLDNSGEEALETTQPEDSNEETDGETEANPGAEVSDETKTDDDDFIPDVEDPSDTPDAEPQKFSKREKFERYSKGVQRRINKEVRRTNDLRAENAELRARMDSLESSTQNNTVIKQAKEDAARLDNRLRNATAMKQQYMEDGDYAKASQVDTDIMDMTVQRNKIPTSEQLNEYFTQQAEATRPAPRPEQQVNIPQAQQNWIQADTRYAQDQNYSKYVDDTYDQMMGEGYNPEDPRMYAELDRRIGKTAQAPAPVQPQAPAPRQRPVAAPSPNTGSQAQTPVKPTGLTSADKHNMKQWGLDPSSKVARAEWLANKGKR